MYTNNFREKYEFSSLVTQTKTHLWTHLPQASHSRIPPDHKNTSRKLLSNKDLLRKNSSIECFNYFNAKLSSMGQSLAKVLSNRRLRKNNSKGHPSSATPTDNTSSPHTISHASKRKKLRSKNTKPLKNHLNKTKLPLDTSFGVNLSNVTLTNDETQLLARGLTFCPNPRRIDWRVVNTDFNEFARRMRITEFFHDSTTGNIYTILSTLKVFGHLPLTETLILMHSIKPLKMFFSQPPQTYS